MITSSKRMKWVGFKKKAILLVISTLLFLFLAEVIVRYHLFGSSSFSQTEMASNSPERWTEVIQIPKNSPLFYELKPNVDVLYKFARLKTNSDGQTDRTYSLEKPDSTIRVAVIGDSYTMGGGVERAHLYHELIEEQLNREEGGLNYEFINFAVSGYNFENYIDVLETKVLKYAPDIVLIGFCAENDFKYSKGRQYKTDQIKNKEPRGFYSLFLVRFVKAHVKSWQKKLPSTAIQKKNDDFIQDAFSHIHGFSKEHNIPIALAYLSTLHQKDDPTRLRVAQLANLNQFKYVDASILFKDTNQRDYILNFLNAHPNKEANKLFAKSILDSLDFRAIWLGK